MRLGREPYLAWLQLVGNGDGSNRRSVLLQPAGQTDIGEQVPAGGRYSGSAAVKTLGSQISWISAVDDMTGNAFCALLPVPASSRPARRR